jgi:hypothetical protein
MMVSLTLQQISKDNGFQHDNNQLRYLTNEMKQKIVNEIKQAFEQDICKSVNAATKKVFNKQRYDLEPLLTLAERDHTIQISGAD